MKLLGISASLRNLRSGGDSKSLIDELCSISSREHLTEYIKNQANLSISTFIRSGRGTSLSFDEIYANLKKDDKRTGLSNSEVLLAVALWKAKSCNMDIEHISLSEILGETSKQSTIRDSFLEKINSADGILISGPVYFGDRGSLTHSLIQLLRHENKYVKDKFLAGISVGAKRNGGQETTLIYQMVDFLNIGMLAVGNDAETTAQYGGTGHAGDVGTICSDNYGIDTSLGTGNRIAQAIILKSFSDRFRLKGKPRIGIIILQDLKDTAKRLIHEKILSTSLSEEADFRLFYFVDEKVNRCLACDICPCEVGNDDVYRCVIKKEDLFSKYHKDLVDLDALLIGGYSPEHFYDYRSIYQIFIERTRYIRRSNYIYSNLLVAPIIFKDIRSREYLEIRIITSMIRHHTIMHKPIIFDIQDGDVINDDSAINDLNHFIDLTKRYVPGRIYYNYKYLQSVKYNPVGYTLSSAKDFEQDNVEKRDKALCNRKQYFEQLFKSSVTEYNEY
jgi:multimeric flavodoxin WrbA